MPVALNIAGTVDKQAIKEYRRGMLIVETGKTDSGRYEVAATWGKDDCSNSFEHFSYTTSDYLFATNLFNAICRFGITGGKKQVGLK